VGAPAGCRCGHHDGRAQAEYACCARHHRWSPAACFGPRRGRGSGGQSGTSLAADRLGRLTLAPTPTEPLPSAVPSNPGDAQLLQARKPRKRRRRRNRSKSHGIEPGPYATWCAHAASVGGEPHHGCCSSAISAFAHANPFSLLAETGKSCQGGSVACLCVPTAFGFPHGQEPRARRASRLAPR
jgi:hypothetical protein